jgi:uncharacterized protein (TIGR00730 family)
LSGRVRVVAAMSDLTPSPTTRPSSTPSPHSSTHAAAAVQAPTPAPQLRALPSDPVLLRRLCVFCGSGSGSDPRYVEQAQQFGELLAASGIGLVYGGASVGLMGAVADGALRRGGEVIGVIPRSLALKEIFHEHLTQLHVVESMHERKALMAELADGFVALPGGYGTFDELCEILTWAQLGIHRKPVGLLNVLDYFDGLLRFFDHSLSQGFIGPAHRSMICLSADPSSLIEQLRQHTPLEGPKWLNQAQT